jgi:hypothetical protein
VKSGVIVVLTLEEAQHRVNSVMRVRGAPPVLAKVGVKEEEI